jgi:hypothetical protein
MNKAEEFQSCDWSEFKKKYSHLANEKLLKMIWEYGNNRWSKGYEQGHRNPYFD